RPHRGAQGDAGQAGPARLRAARGAVPVRAHPRAAGGREGEAGRAARARGGTGVIAPMTDTRDKLLSAAEQLFAERGVDAVSLREITRAAGARNVIAVQYHFEDRAGVLTAILAKHLPDVDARRHALLDELEANGEPTARGIAGALVRPLAAKLADPDG